MTRPFGSFFLIFRFPFFHRIIHNHTGFVWISNSAENKQFVSFRFFPNEKNHFSAFVCSSPIRPAATQSFEGISRLDCACASQFCDPIPVRGIIQSKQLIPVSGNDSLSLERRFEICVQQIVVQLCLECQSQFNSSMTTLRSSSNMWPFSRLYPTSNNHCHSEGFDTRIVDSSDAFQQRNVIYSSLTAKSS